MNARKPTVSARRPALLAGKSRIGKSGVRAAAGLVGSASAITGAGIAAWMLPATAVQAAQADDKATQAASLTAFTLPPASTVPASMAPAGTMSPGQMFGALGGNQAPLGPAGNGPPAATFNQAHQSDAPAANPSVSPGAMLAQAPPAPGGAPSGTGRTVDNGLEPTASWLERSTAADGTLIMPDNQLAIHYPPDASVPNCENGCTKVFQWVLPTQPPDPSANPPQINDTSSAVNWYFALPAEKEQYANFLVPPGTSYSSLREGLQQTISPDGTILGGPDYVFGISKGILLMPTAPDKIPMSALPQDGPGPTAYAQLASALGITDVAGNAFLGNPATSLDPFAWTPGATAASFTDAPGPGPSGSSSQVADLPPVSAASPAAPTAASNSQDNSPASDPGAMDPIGQLIPATPHPNVGLGLQSPVPFIPFNPSLTTPLSGPLPIRATPLQFLNPGTPVTFLPAALKFTAFPDPNGDFSPDGSPDAPPGSGTGTKLALADGGSAPTDTGTPAGGGVPVGGIPEAGDIPGASAITGMPGSAPVAPVPQATPIATIDDTSSASLGGGGEISDGLGDPIGGEISDGLSGDALSGGIGGGGIGGPGGGDD